MRSDTQLWTRHEMDMGEGMPEEVFHMPATPEEIKEAMPDAMHWLPISEDAVFDRSESMLFRLAKYDTTDASGIYHGTYLDMVETYRPFITHYARITEPK